MSKFKLSQGVTWVLLTLHSRSVPFPEPPQEQSFTDTCKWSTRKRDWLSYLHVLDVFAWHGKSSKSASCWIQYLTHCFTSWTEKVETSPVHQQPKPMLRSNAFPKIGSCTKHPGSFIWVLSPFICNNKMQQEIRHRGYQRWIKQVLMNTSSRGIRIQTTCLHIGHYRHLQPAWHVNQYLYLKNSIAARGR